MRHSGNIFEGESYRGTGVGTISNVTVVTIALSAISVLAVIGLIANFGEITAKIAIWMADVLSSGFPILLIVVAIIYLVARLKWKMRRRFWGW